ncbi:MAG TPA: hypothetical protein VFZ64_13650 [Nocardioidaceae bacterium]
MTRYADPTRCPDCRSAMPYGAPRCPGCGLLLEGPLAAELFTTLRTADGLLARMRTASVTPEPAAVTAEPGDLAAATVTAGTAASARNASAEEGVLATRLRPRRPAGGGEPGPPPPRGPHPHPGLSGASVPKILLALGALCLLVAALVFLAVAWSAMGVAGRTTTLLGFTALSGALTWWVAGRDLRAAAESLAVVTLGLLTFDLFGARDAGWFGAIETSEFLVALGVAVAAAGAAAALAARRTPVSVLQGAEVVASLGIAVAVAGLVQTEWLAWSAGLTVAVVVTAGIAAASHRAGLLVLAVGAALVCGVTWLQLSVSAAARAVANPGLEELWIDLEVWPLLAAALLVGAVGAVRRLPVELRLVAVGASVVLVSLAVLAPATDETTTALTTVVAALVTGLAALCWVLRQPWRQVLVGALALGLLWMAVTWLQLATTAASRMLDAGADLWTRGAGDGFPARPVADWEPASWLLPVVAVAVVLALVALARTYPGVDRVVAPLLDLDVVLAATAATVALTLALHAVPIALVLAVLLGAGGYFAARSVRGSSLLRLALSAAFLAAALQLSLHAEWLTLPALLVVLLAAALVHLRSATLDVSVLAGALAAGAVAGVVWTIGGIASTPTEWTSLVTLLVLAGAVLGLPYVDERFRLSGPASYARLGPEVGALLAAAVVALAGIDLARSTVSEATWLAVDLTVMGAAASAMALLRPDRRAAGWLGGLLLASASWVRLAELGVDTPEAYTLPSALALLTVGLVHLRRVPGAGTMTALGPGLGLALVPSLLWVLAEPIGLRSLLLGLATLGLVVAGVRLRWSGPLVYGAVAGAVLVVRLATPVAEAVPRWALIGAAGVLLVTLGITWEKRVRDARAVAGYVRGLR